MEVTLVDIRNYFLFQPLIYEVANTLLNVEDVAHSIRGLLRGRQTPLPARHCSNVDWYCRSSFSRAAAGSASTISCSRPASRLTSAACQGQPTTACRSRASIRAPIRARMLRRLELAAADPQLVSAGALDVVMSAAAQPGSRSQLHSSRSTGAPCEEFPGSTSRAEHRSAEAGDTILSGFHPKLRPAAQRISSSAASRCGSLASR